MGVTLLGLLVVVVFGTGAAHLVYRSDQPRPFLPNAERVYWDTQTPFLDDQSDQGDQDAPDQSESLQVRQSD